MHFYNKCVCVLICVHRINMMELVYILNVHMRLHVIWHQCLGCRRLRCVRAVPVRSAWCRRITRSWWPLDARTSRKSSAGRREERITSVLHHVSGRQLNSSAEFSAVLEVSEFACVSDNAQTHTILFLTESKKWRQWTDETEGKCLFEGGIKYCYLF